MTAVLAGYRVLDLCDAKGVLCTKIMADLGADVIIVEPPQGRNTRHRLPFYHDQPNSEKSLFFWYFNTNKRSITFTGDTLYMSPAFRLSATPAALRPAPCLGRHNTEVYGKLLGMCEAEIAPYTEEQVFY